MPLAGRNRVNADLFYANFKRFPFLCWHILWNKNSFTNTNFFHFLWTDSTYITYLTWNLVNTIFFQNQNSVNQGVGVHFLKVGDVKFWLDWRKYGTVSYSFSCMYITLVCELEKVSCHLQFGTQVEDQLILKWLFDVFKFFWETNENTWTWGTIVL